MLFWTIILFLHDLFFFIKRDNWLSRHGKKIIKFNIDEFEGKETVKTHKDGLIIIGLGILLYGLLYAIITGIYLYNGLKIDTYIWPSVLVILLIFINLIKNKKDKPLNKMTETEVLEYKLKAAKYGKRKVYGTIFTLIKLSYFVYIGYILLTTT